MLGWVKKWAAMDRRFAAPYLVLLLSLIPTVVTFFVVREIANERDSVRFSRSSEDCDEMVRATAGQYMDLLLSVRGFVGTRTNMLRNGWVQYVGSLNLAQRYPALVRISCAPRVPAWQRDAHEAQMRLQGAAGYSIVGEIGRAHV